MAYQHYILILYVFRYLIKYNKVRYEQFRYNTLKLNFDKFRKLKKNPSNQIRQINYYIFVILLPFFLFVCQLNVHVVVFYFK